MARAPRIAAGVRRRGDSGADYDTPSPRRLLALAAPSCLGRRRHAFDIYEPTKVLHEHERAAGGAEVAITYLAACLFTMPP